MYAMGKLLSLLLGWDFDASMLISAAIVLVYILLGGLTSAIYNEVLQFFMIVFGFAPLTWLGLRALGGWDGLTARLTQTATAAFGQQWDAPNGWPPLQWLAIEGVRRYGRADLADNMRDRRIALNRRAYRVTGKMTEKYDIVDVNRPAGGGEYPTQDGFGWTNGVALALSAQQARLPAPPIRESRPLEAVR